VVNCGECIVDVVLVLVETRVNVVWVLVDFGDLVLVKTGAACIVDALLILDNVVDVVLVLEETGDCIDVAVLVLV